MVCPRATPKLTGLWCCNRGAFPGRSPGKGRALCALQPLLLLQVCPRPCNVLRLQPPPCKAKTASTAVTDL